MSWLRFHIPNSEWIQEAFEYGCSLDPVPKHYSTS